MSQIRTIGKTLLFFLLLLSVSPVWAQKYGFEARAQAREASRWTLSEWLAQRDRNRMMDLWLSMNSPSPFEFGLGVIHHSRKTSTGPATTEESHISLGGELHAYAQFIGLTVEHENDTKAGISDLSGLLNIRLLGNSLQNSALTLHVGQRTRKFNDDSDDLRQLLTQVSLQIYLTRFFGIDGLYRQAHKVDVSGRDGKVGGTQTEVGAFIDFRAVRVFGAWSKEVNRFEPNTGGSSQDTIRDGIKAGLKIFY